MEERNLFEGVSIERLEKALSLLYSNDEFEIKVKLTPKKKKNRRQPVLKIKKQIMNRVLKTHCNYSRKDHFMKSKVKKSQLF